MRRAEGEGITELAEGNETEERSGMMVGREKE